MIKPAAILAFVFVATSAIRAQPDNYYIQDDNGKLVRVNRSEEERHCITRPLDAGGCLLLVKPGGQRASVPLPAYPISTQPLSEEQKRLLNGPSPDPTLPVSSIEAPPGLIPIMQPTSLDPVPSSPKSQSSYVDAENAQPSPRPYFNPCDAVCEQEKINSQQQQDGQALKHHREQVHAENTDWIPKGKHGEKVINLDNGTAFIVDKNGKMRRVEAPLGEQEQILMEQLRKDFVAMSDANLNHVFAKMAADGARSSWIELRQAYCSHYRGAKYINLEGREDRCK